MSKQFHGNAAVITSPEVWAVIHARHKSDLKVFSSFSNPTGTELGGDGREGVMETTYGITGADFPLMGARTAWTIGEKVYERIDERHEYFLFIARKDSNE